MNNMRLVSLSVVAIIAMACILPLTFDESDADSTERISTQYVYRAQFELEFPEGFEVDNPYGQDYEDWLSSWELYFIDGSTNDQAMERYLEDPLENSVQSDDRSILENYPAGTPINIYVFFSGDGGQQTRIDYFSQYEYGEKVLEPYGGLSFFVKAGDTFSLEIISIEGIPEDRHPSVRVWYDNFYEDISSELEFTHEFTKSGEVNVELNTSSLYTDVVYDVSGESSPNGSATAYIIICALVTIVVLAILVYVARKPGWSK